MTDIQWFRREQLTEAIVCPNWVDGDLPIAMVQGGACLGRDLLFEELCMPCQVGFRTRGWKNQTNI